MQNFTPIHLRNIPDKNKPELFNHCFLLEFFAYWIKPESYLEIGVRDGRSLIPVSKWCKKCFAVDVNFLHRNFPSNVHLFETTSDNFFELFNKEIKFDMVFIDGDHNKDQVYKDFLNVKDRIIDDGFVFFHDSYPHDEYLLAPAKSNNCWEAVLKIKNEFYNDWEIITLPFTPGVTIMKKMSLQKQLIWK